MECFYLPRHEISKSNAGAFRAILSDSFVKPGRDNPDVPEIK